MKAQPEHTSPAASPATEPRDGRARDPALDQEYLRLSRTSRMTGWYNLDQLPRTAVDVALSSLVGGRSDYRLVEALARDVSIIDDFADREELWFDYAADTGDGWNSTYAIAALLGRSSLDLQAPEGPQRETSRTPDRTPRGEFLVLGGDEVYPTPSSQRYRDRLVRPFECALDGTEPPHPMMLAIPGNHDWYDGLQAFNRLFCQRRWIGGWRTRQERSYFALLLPHRWWLLGVDIQLESDIDGPQKEYFLGLLDHQERGAPDPRKIQPGDRVILCTAEPAWVLDKIYPTGEKVERAIDFLEDKLTQHGARVAVTLAGDQHHYRRHEHRDAVTGLTRHKIIAGGGGAFLHPTSGPDVSELEIGADKETFHLKKDYPEPAVCRRLALRNFAFPVLNWQFGGVFAAIYMLLSWLMPRPRPDAALSQALVDALATSFLHPAVLAVGLFVVLGFVLFTDMPNQPWHRRIAGGAHAVAHLVAALVLTWVVNRWVGLPLDRVAATRVGIPAEEAIRMLASDGSALPGDMTMRLLFWMFVERLATSLATLLLAGVVGSFILGLYLWVSLTLFGRHVNESFSSLRIQDYKNFLRLHIDRAGRLTIFAVGLERVPRRWRVDPSSGQSERLVPEDTPLSPHLIEKIDVA
ncbi:MAG TPA: calcineurin [Polyangia bacterium]|jgi:hypothetical protein|nr:calcineurin [Polyangia bacterium]